MIRLAEPADIPAIHALVERAFRGDSARAGWTHEADLLDGQRTDRAAIGDILNDSAQAILLMIDQGELEACVQVAVRDGNAYLGMLSVAPDRQGRGIGGRLLDAAEDRARRYGATVMEMTVIEQRQELVDYYIRRGYEPTGETRPFPSDNPRFGVPKVGNLRFVVLQKRLA